MSFEYAVSYLKNPNLSRAGAKHQYTPEQIEDYKRCRDDIEYFAEKYYTIVHIDKGKIKIPLYKYQKSLLHNFEDNRFNIVCQCRQSGKSTTILVYIMHYILFNEDKTVAILANKGKTARKLLRRLKMAYELLPLWMKPGVKKWNESEIELDNGCIVMAEATSSDNIRGDSVSLVVIDEVAAIEGWTDFYDSVYPTISSGKESRVIMISTMKGMNHFFFMWEKAKKRKSNFVPFEVLWFDVPGRDDEWKAETIANTSEESFMQEQENIALGSSNTLIGMKALREMTPFEPKAIHENVKYFDDIYKDHKYVIVVDVGHGKSLDYSVANVFDVTEYPYKQVAIFRDNETSSLIFPYIIANLGLRFNNAAVLIETNDIGESVVNDLNYDLEYENIISVKTHNEKYALGVRTTKTVKAKGCSYLKPLIEDKKLLIFDESTIFEFSNFAVKGNSYEAEEGHDDTITTCWLFAWLTRQPEFEEIVNHNLVGELYDNKINRMMEELSPVGFIENGLPEVSETGNKLVLEDGHLWEIIE